MNEGVGNGKCAKVIGMSLFYASMQAALGSVEMSSKFSVKNFSKDQETLQNAADALREYLVIALVWTVATMLIQGSQYGWLGATTALLANALFVMWIYFSYKRAFAQAAKKGNLKLPRIIG